MRPSLLAFLVASVLLAQGCAIRFGAGRPAQLPRNTVIAPEAEQSRCNRAYPGDEFRMPLAEAEDDPELRAELEAIPNEVRRTVLAVGLEPVLARMLRDKRLHPDDATQASFVARRQAIAMQLVALSSQLDASVYAADCLGDRAEVIRAGVDHESSAREIRRTVASIVVGAVVGIAIGAWELADEDSRARSAFAIGGGAVAGGLGVSAFVERPTPIALDHPRNVLDPIFHGDDPDRILPTFVFRMLSLPVDAGATPRDALLIRFASILGDAVTEADRERAEELVFGVGGIYTPELLHARERMLDEVESALSAFVRDLELLQRWLGRAFDDGLLLDSSAGEQPRR